MQRFQLKPSTDNVDITGASADIQAPITAEGQDVAITVTSGTTDIGGVITTTGAAGVTGGNIDVQSLAYQITCSLFASAGSQQLQVLRLVITYQPRLMPLQPLLLLPVRYHNRWFAGGLLPKVVWWCC